MQPSLSQSYQRGCPTPISFESPQPFAPSISEAYGATQTQAQFLPEIVHQQDTTARINEQGMQRSQGAFEQQQQRMQQVGLQQQRFQQQQALQQMDFSQADGLRMQKLQQGMAGVQEAMDNHTLSKEEGQQLMLQIKTGIDPLQMRQQQTMEKMRQQKMKFDMEDHAHQTAMNQQADEALMKPPEMVYGQGTPAPPVGADVGAAIGGIGGAIQGGVSDAMQAKPGAPIAAIYTKGVGPNGRIIRDKIPFPHSSGPTPEQKQAADDKKAQLAQDEKDRQHQNTIFKETRHQALQETTARYPRPEKREKDATGTGGESEDAYQSRLSDWRDQFDSNLEASHNHLLEAHPGWKDKPFSGGAQTPSTLGVITPGQPAPAAPPIDKDAIPPDWTPEKEAAYQAAIKKNPVLPAPKGEVHVSQEQWDELHKPPSTFWQRLVK